MPRDAVLLQPHAHRQWHALPPPPLVLHALVQRVRQPQPVAGGGHAQRRHPGTQNPGRPARESGTPAYATSTSPGLKQNCHTLRFVARRVRPKVGGPSALRLELRPSKLDTVAVNSGGAWRGQ